MTSREHFRDPKDSYIEHIKTRRENYISSIMGNTIPLSIEHSIMLAKKNVDSIAGEYLDPDLKENLGNIYKKTTKKYKLFTEKARESLNMFYQGKISVEVAHQPKFMGGEKFVFNKIALGGILSSFDDDFYPFYYLADYDKVHGELIRTHMSLVNSGSGFPVSIPSADEAKHDGTSIRLLPIPNEAYMEELYEQIRKNYTFSISSCIESGYQQSLLEERVEATIKHIKLAYHRASTYNDWFLNIIGPIANIFNDYGFLFVISSDPEYRKLLTPFYEYLLQNRNKYVDQYRRLSQQFKEKGFEPPLRSIDKGFVPFFYECPNENCFKQRVLLSAEETDSMVVLQGKCDVCGTLHEIITNKSKPDLSDYYIHLTPRVESRQYLVSKTSAPAIHIAGTGETRYYTMSIPLMRRIDDSILLPVIHFYNKITTNTFITRCLEEEIKRIIPDKYLNSLKSLMKNLGKFKKKLKKSRVDEKQVRDDILSYLTRIKNDMENIEKLCDNTINKVQPEESNMLKSYLSNLFGKIAVEKHGQEAVFHWIDLVIKHGFDGLLNDYRQIYKKQTPPGFESFA